MWLCHHSDPERHNKGFCWPCHCATAAATSATDAFSVICQLCHGPPQVSFYLIVEPLTNSLYQMFVLVMLFAFCFQVAMLTNGAQLLRFALLQPFRIYPWQVYVPPGDGPWPTPKVAKWLLLPLLWVGGASCFSFSCPPDDSVNSESVVLLNLVILVWWLDIRLMNFHEPNQQNIVLLDLTFPLVSEARCKN